MLSFLLNVVIFFKKLRKYNLNFDSKFFFQIWGWALSLECPKILAKFQPQCPYKLCPYSKKVVYLLQPSKLIHCLFFTLNFRIDDFASSSSFVTHEEASRSWFCLYINSRRSILWKQRWWQWCRRWRWQWRRWGGDGWGGEGSILLVLPGCLKYL